MDDTCFILRHYSKNQMIDDVVDGVAMVGLVISGEVDVYSVAVDGRDIRLNTLHTGECFGIYNLLADMEMQTVLHCGEDSEIGYLPKKVLLQMMETDNRLALRYARVCNEKLQFLLRRIEFMTLQSCRGKLVSYLLAQRDRSGMVHISGSREELARHLGMSRATLFREIAALQQQGVLQSRNGTLCIPDTDAMERLLRTTA